MKIGTEVEVVKDDGTIWHTKTRSEPWQLRTGDWVVLLEGKSGGYDLNRVTKVGAASKDDGAEAKQPEDKGRKG